jgi:hypothetical protein
VEVTAIDANAPLAPRGRVDGYTGLTIPSRDAHLYLRKSLDDVADLVFDDGLGCRYQLTPQSVRRAVAAGATAGQILDLLDRVVQGTLPSSLRVRVQGWAGTFGDVAIGQVGILVAPGPEAFRDLRGDPALAGAFIQSISASAAIVDLDALAGLRAALAERGITTSPYVAPSRDATATSVPSSAGADVDGPDLISLTPSQTERVLDRALARGRALAIDYRQETGSRVARYVVRPREIRNRDGSLFLTAYCDAFQDDRDFRIANIVAVGFPHEF